MNLKTELEALRQHLRELADARDEGLSKRYALRRPSLPPGLYWRMRWLGARFLRFLEWLHIKNPDPWPPDLKHARKTGQAKPLLIWAVGTDRDTLREACRGFSRLEDLQGFAPVLVTDIADFAFFSRLGWLIEYLPNISGEGPRYDERKARFLARL